MKTSIVILYIAVAAVILYLAYKAYSNYGLSGSIFSSSPLTTTNSVSRVTYYPEYSGNPRNVSRFVATDGQQMNGHNH